ncbi:MAG: hypothetical protein IPK07_08540 [Deltaproteobacteria bacterium]|nr:hypothetical protein [Deltaproteobacteria bacterium]
MPSIARRPQDLLLGAWLAAALTLATGSNAAVNPQADAALGQPSFVANILNQTSSQSLFFPYDVARDGSVGNTRLYVVDNFNNRVLGYECAGSNCVLGNDAAAVKVFGQAGMTGFYSNGGVGGAVTASTLSSPRGVAVDASGTLYVADTSNNRVLVFQNPWSDAVADVVIGQTGMGAASAGSTLAKLRAPEGVFVDAGGALWIADTGNHRVLKFTSIATGATAAFAIGGSGAASATTMSSPKDVAVDASGWLYVADWGFSRVLGFSAPGSGATASVVLGHGGSFTNGSANHGGVSAASLGLPEKLGFDAAGRLWVSDTGNHRVLEYDNPHVAGNATRVFGQADRGQNATFATNVTDAPDGFPNALGMNGPRGMAFDGNGTMWLCDHDSSRVLAFDNPIGGSSAALVADRALGKSVFVDAAANVATSRSMNNPTGVAVDRSVSPNRVWVADIGNNRALGFPSSSPAPTNQAASKLLGQASFTASATNAGINGSLQNAANAVASATSLFFPEGVAVDRFGNVYVADTSNSRVLEYDDPFARDATADTVLGQSSFTARNPSYPYGNAASLAGPRGLAIAPDDDLWVADTLDHRVVRFANAPNQPATGGTANLVLGQASFASSQTFPAYTSGCSATRMNAPGGVHVGPSGRAYVADSMNHRVLVFEPPFSNGMAADFVIGQTSLTSCNANRGGAASAATLNEPRAVLEDDAGNLYVADYGNNRVVVHEAPFGGGDFVADDVLGQPDFTSNTYIPAGPDSLYNPSGLALDDSNHLFVADREGSRVTRYVVDGAPTVLLDPIASPIVAGQFLSLSGAGFTAGSVIQVFVATSSGIQSYGPYAPNNWATGYLIWLVDPTIELGVGFATIVVINTDQGYIQSNPEGQLLYGDPARNMPTITAVNGVALSAADPSVPLANVTTQLAQGSTVTLGGTGFSSPLVNLYTAQGNLGPLTPQAGATSPQIRVTIPANAPTGPGSLEVVNSPYTGNVKSNAVSVPIGEPLDITSVSQSGGTVTVDGSGFSTLTVINLFASNGAGGVTNLGGLDGSGAGRVPITFVSSSRFTFTVPSAAKSGKAFVEALNPPFIPASSTGNDAQGAFTLITP